MRIHIKKLASLLFALAFLIACAPTTQSSGIEIRTGEKVEREIKQPMVFDNCFSAEPVNNDLTFKKILGEKLTKELTLGISGVVEADIPKIAKLGIEAEITERFSLEKTVVLEDTLVTQFEVPGYTKKQLTFVFQEILREGEVSFIYNGQERSTGYSYRINLISAGWKVEDLSCEPDPSQAETLPPAEPNSCDGGFDSAIWTSVSTSDEFIPLQVGHCWSLNNYGLTMTNGTVSILESDGPAKASWYGVTRSVPMIATVRLNVHLERLVGGAEIWIGFTDSPSNIDNGKFLAIKKAAQAKPSYISAFSVAGRNAGFRYTVFDNVFDPNDTGNYFIEMKLDSNRLSIWLNRSPARAFPLIEIGTSHRYLFIGYLATTQVDIDARVYNIQILP